MSKPIRLSLNKPFSAWKLFGYAEGANEITIVDPEMARNGRHTEKDEPKVCQPGEEQSYSVQTVFQAPEEITRVARFLADVVKKRNHCLTDI